MNASKNSSGLPAWADQAKVLLDDSAQRYDAATLSRLNRARQTALEHRHRHSPRPWFLSAGLASACALVLAVTIWHGRTSAPSGIGAEPAATLAASGHDNGLNASDMDMVSGDDSLELYQNLEFYAWLQAQHHDTDG